MNKFLVIVTAMMLSFATGAQELKNKFGENYYTPALYKQEYKEAEGSPYLDEQFKPAKINDIEEIKLVRFNAMENQVEIMVKGNNVMILDDTEPYVIALQDGSKRVYKTKSFIGKKGDEEHGFFLLLHTEDSFELYLKEEKKFQKEVKAQGYQDSKPAQFKKEPDTFYVTDFIRGKDVLVQVPDRVNKLAELFPSGSKQMKDYIREAKLDLDKADALVMVFSEYFSNYATP